MAHHLADFEQTCNQICTASLGHASSDPLQGASLSLIEVSSDGKLSNRPIDGELLETYIERDFQENPKIPIATSSSGSTIKIIHSSRHYQHRDEQLVPLAMDSSVFKRLAKWIRMPKAFPSVLATGTPMFHEAEPKVPDSALQSLDVDRKHLSFILQSVPGGRWSCCFSAAFTYSFTTRCMYIFLHTCELEVSQSLPEAINVMQFATKEQSPFLIPSAIVKHHLETRVQSLNRKKDEIFHLECRMGVRRDNATNVDLLTINFSDTISHISALNAGLAWTLHSCRRTERLLDLMDTITIRYASLAEHAGVPEAEYLFVQQLLRDSHAFLQSWNQGIADRAQYLTARLQALSQSVYSGIAQRDSATSNSIAATSTQLAHTSHKIAISTLNDSSAMRIITAVTVAFLPGTFVATFFSTTFFNFGAGDNGKVYSKWVWLYFVLTVGLTTVVYAVMRVMHKAKEMTFERREFRSDESKLDANP